MFGSSPKRPRQRMTKCSHDRRQPDPVIPVCRSGGWSPLLRARIWAGFVLEPSAPCGILPASGARKSNDEAPIMFRRESSRGAFGRACALAATSKLRAPCDWTFRPRTLLLTDSPSCFGSRLTVLPSRRPGSSCRDGVCGHCLLLAFMPMLVADRFVASSRLAVSGGTGPGRRMRNLKSR